MRDFHTDPAEQCCSICHHLVPMGKGWLINSTTIGKILLCKECFDRMCEIDDEDDEDTEEE